MVILANFADYIHAVGVTDKDQDMLNTARRMAGINLKTLLGADPQRIHITQAGLQFDRR